MVCGRPWILQSSSWQVRHTFLSTNQYNTKVRDACSMLRSMVLRLSKCLHELAQPLDLTGDNRHFWGCGTLRMTVAGMTELRELKAMELLLRREPHLNDLSA